ncbi:radical SAM protein [Pararhodospirillum oryzae]|uniref:His-Xaa-Ser system radical SAM maturase HxsB n=1 Tax=Pararhodospirillum oryzae TaxID=478448 RepID=A0A512H561_9PROT|nr:radical SAM protein [Pararhodospirillum oryzae]GEO80583.1 His-Xaa-Ser system radical SAM maturase HxsB [Pararhodospirillum oryzae]
MTHLFPYRFQALARDILFSTDTGDFFTASPAFLDRLVRGDLDAGEKAFLRERGFACEEPGDFYWESYRHRLARKKRIGATLSYVVLVPTIRCDLDCRYCQASRARVEAKESDWSADTLARVLAFLDGLPTDRMLIEFQGGEPTLRLDLVDAVITHARQRFAHTRFVICTNLNQGPGAVRDLLRADDVSLSTSLDGPPDLQQKNRGLSPGRARAFFRALEELLTTFGPEKVAALPTILPEDTPRIPDIIETYRALGYPGVFLRPANRQGFARRLLGHGATNQEPWPAAWRRALDYLLATHRRGARPMREFGLETAVRRIFSPNHTAHVDLRSPNPAACDHVLIDHDGTFYPSDEARMVTRVGVADLSLGTVRTGLDPARVRAFSWSQMADVQEDCVHCVHLPWCGIDGIDDIAWHGRADPPKPETHFCRQYRAVFDYVFDALVSCDPDRLAFLSFHLNGCFEPTPFVGPFRHDAP